MDYENTFILMITPKRGEEYFYQFDREENARQYGKDKMSDDNMRNFKEIKRIELMFNGELISKLSSGCTWSDVPATKYQAIILLKKLGIEVSNETIDRAQRDIMLERSRQIAAAVARDIEETFKTNHGEIL